MTRSSFSAVLAALVLGCGGPAVQSQASTTPTAAGPAAEQGPGEAIPVRPLDPAPAALTDAESRDIAGLCAPIEPEMYDAHKVALAALDEALRTDVAAAKAEADAVAKGVAELAKARGLGGADKTRCEQLFAKREAVTLFEHEPAEEEARSVVDSCVKRVDAVFGKETMGFDVGGGGQQISTGPFCPDDLPVPPSLSQLPYKSSKEDWDTPAWRCLQFGLRIEQKVQVEYLAPRGARAFTCIARLLPRHGGAPVELFRGGRVNEEGVLEIAAKTQQRRMAPEQ